MLTIKVNNKISKIQKEFNGLFPYLKLEFFKHQHKVYGANPKKDILKSEIILKPVNTQKGKTEIVLDENMPVSLLEQLFMEKFGISAQVFRKSGKSWLETTMTDDWTLKRQNDEGKELSVLNR